MKTQLHTPKGIIEIDTDTVTNAQLLKLGIKRENLPQAPRDPLKELDDLKKEHNDLVIKLKLAGSID